MSDGPRTVRLLTRSRDEYGPFPTYAEARKWADLHVPHDTGYGIVPATAGGRHRA